MLLCHKTEGVERATGHARDGHSDDHMNDDHDEDRDQDMDRDGDCEMGQTSTALTPLSLALAPYAELARSEGEVRALLDSWAGEGRGVPEASRVALRRAAEDAAAMAEGQGEQDR